MIPFINNVANTTTSTPNTQSVGDDIIQDSESVNTLSAFKILKTILLLSTYDFTNSLNMPFWLDALYRVLAIIFTFTVARIIYIGGGA